MVGRFGGFRTVEQSKRCINHKMSKFKSQICRICGACKAKEPYFCIAMHSVDRNMFAKILKHTVALKYNDREKFSELDSFRAFVGRYCNNPQLCKFRTPDCALLQNAVKCYEMFLNQSGTDLTVDDKSNIYSHYSVKNLRDVGWEFIVPKKPLKKIAKKQRRRINNVVDKAVRSVPTEEEKSLAHKENKKSSAKNNNTKVKKSVTTELFYNDNEEWRQKIGKILGVDQYEANN